MLFLTAQEPARLCKDEDVRSHFLGERDACVNKQKLSQVLKTENFLQSLSKINPKPCHETPDFQEQDLLDLTESTQNSSNLKTAAIRN